LPQTFHFVFEECVLESLDPILELGLETRICAEGLQVTQASWDGVPPRFYGSFPQSFKVGAFSVFKDPSTFFLSTLKGEGPFAEQLWDGKPRGS
jgi:hypothetical protein